METTIWCEALSRSSWLSFVLDHRDMCETLDEGEGLGGDIGFKVSMASEVKVLSMASSAHSFFLVDSVVEDYFLLSDIFKLSNSFFYC